MRDTLVLFDIGSTLFHLDFGEFYRRAADLSKDKNAEQFAQAYTASGLNHRVMEGVVTSEEFYEELREIIDPVHPVSDDELKEVFGSFLLDPISEMIEIKKRVHEAGYSVGLFSNISEVAYEIISKNNPEIFEHSVYNIFSYKVGAVKPDPKTYVAEGFKNIIFIDDKVSYLETGLKVGWKCIWITPYIDKAEIRITVDKDKAPPVSDDFRTANSVEEVVEALRYFGTKI